MRRVGGSVCSIFLAAISKLTCLSDARTSLKFMVVILGVLLPGSVVIYTTNLRATSNIITVNNTTDPASVSGNGFCTLREAINNANSASDTTSGDCVAGTGTDTINFSVSGTITLSSTLPAIANASPGSLTIDGSGQNVTVDGANSFQVLRVNTGATLNLNSLTIAHGNGGGSDGGAIYDIGTLAITNSTLSDNAAPNGGHGGGVFSATGGAGPTLTISNSTFAGNSASGSSDGGGIYDHGVPLTITGSTFSNNSGYGGGGVYSDATTVSISNSTFSGNSASAGDGGGILTSSSLAVTNSTFSGNSAPIGGAIWANSATVTNSILANSTGSNCAGLQTPPFTDGGYNISDDNSCGFAGTGANGLTMGDNVNPQLSVSGLANNGGPTQTIALQSSSPAIDAIPIARCSATDQRGFPRPDPEDTGATHLACDSGAFESGETPSPNIIGYIEACYYCSNAWTFNGALLGLQDGPVFMIENVTGHDITNVTFTANGDSLNVGTVAANNSVVLIPGVSNDGGSGHSFWNTTGSILDTSDFGPDADTLPFDLSGGWNAQFADTGVFTPGPSKSPANDGTVPSINFLGGPDNVDAPCFDCYGPEVVATISLQTGPTPTPTTTFTPTATATTTATATATATQTATATTTPTATATPTTSISVTASLAFGNVPVGDAVSKNITVRNTGTNLLFIGTVSSNDPEFAETSSTCPGGGLAHLASCTIAIGFTPSSLGPHSATISVNDNASSSPQHVAVSGTGVADMTVTPTSFMFSSTKIGSKKTKTITVSNKQTNSVSLSEGFSGTNHGDFSVTGGTCMSTLAAKASCTLIVTYAPSALGTESATMTVTDSPDTLGPYAISFTTGQNIPATVTPATLAFGTTTAAHPNKTKTVTVTNLSASSLSVSESFSGTNAGDFSVTGGTCGASAPANSSCTILVTFTPTLHATAESASVAVTIGSDPTSPHNIALTGTGP